MVESKPKPDSSKVVPEPRIQAVRSKTPIRSSSFKYYIHDATEACRLQLFGELTENEVSELSGCWRTAKTTLGSRKLILDLRGLRAVDDAGKQWLAFMATEGAAYWPEAFLRNAMAGKIAAEQGATRTLPKLSIFGRLISIFRGVRVPAVE